jgi:hypothetical protein
MTVQFMDYKAQTTITGNSGSTYRFLTPWTGDWSDMLATKLSYLRAYDAHDMTLQCDSVSVDYLGDDPNSNQGIISVHCMPAWKLALLVPNSVFRLKRRAGSESFTIHTPLTATTPLKWADGSNVTNTAILPVKKVPVIDVVAYGTRTSVTAATWASYSGCVNSDVFDGAPIGTVMFEGATTSPRQLEDGTMTNDVELSFKVRVLTVGGTTITWNHFWNETKGAWDTLAVPQFASVAMASLLT